MAKVQKESIDDIAVDVSPKKEEAPPAQKPSVGRIVHFQPPPDVDSEPWAAVVTRVDPTTSTVALAIFDPNGYTRYREKIYFSEVPKHGHWNWPPRVV